MVIGVVLTLVVYTGCKALYRRLPLSILTPVLTTFLLLVAILLLLHIPYGQYMVGGRIWTNLLQPATIAFAIPLYRHRKLVKSNAVAILVGLGVGSFFASLTSMALAMLFHLSRLVVVSVAARSVTTPIAMDVSGMIGGSPILTAALVIFTGITGAVSGPWLMRTIGIRSTVAKGAMMGMGGHGIATARAFLLSAEVGSVSSLSMVIAGCFTMVVAPLCTWLLLR